MQTYVLTLDCEACGETMRTRVADLSASEGAELAIDIAMTISQSEFRCDACGGITYLGDVEDICDHEPGRGQEPTP